MYVHLYIYIIAINILHHPNHIDQNVYEIMYIKKLYIYYVSQFTLDKFKSLKCVKKYILHITS